MVLTLRIVDDGGGLSGVALRRHRGNHDLLGKNACRRLAKLLPSLVKDNGTAAEVDFVLAEWLETTSEYQIGNKNHRECIAKETVREAVCSTSATWSKPAAPRQSALTARSVK